MVPHEISKTPLLKVKNMGSEEPSNESKDNLWQKAVSNPQGVYPQQALLLWIMPNTKKYIGTK